MRKMLLLVVGMLCLAQPMSAAERLTARALPKTPEVKPLAVGDAVATQANQRRRVVLPDGSTAYLNQASALKVIDTRKLKVERGEVFLDVTPGAEFSVEGPARKLSLTGGAVALRAGDGGSAVFVTRGQARVEGFDALLTAGQRLDAGARDAANSPRADVLLGWTRELVAAAGPALVPGTEHAGGTLTATTPAGEEVKLTLRRFHIDVVIEDGFARTTIDQTYFNSHTARMEGTFRFPLPADASLSRLAMYVGENLMEGGMVERDYGRAVYESIVHSQQDPALLEWLDGTTFKMRVFPLEPRQEKRLLLCYTQRLAPAQGRLQYRFPAGHSLDAVAQWSLEARVRGGANLAWSCGSHTLTARKDNADLVLAAREKNVKLDRDVVLEVEEDAGAKESARFSLAEQDGHKYLMLRYRPQWPASPRREGRDWVFLVETAADRNPLLARTQIELMRSLLAQAEEGDTFTVATANTRLTLWEREPQPVTPSKVAAALVWLEQAHLIGALDLDRALRELAPVLRKGSHLVHLGGGVPAMGERRQDVLVKRLPEGVRYAGVGVGRRWNRSLLKAAAEHTGCLYTHVNPDEPVAWRAFELGAALNAPRLLDVRVADAEGKLRFLLTGTLLTQGEELCAVARLDEKEPLPRQVVVTGTLDGRPLEARLEVADVAKEAAYLPRHWAKLEIDRLLAEDAGKHKDAIVALSKAQYVMTPFTSLLVLENEDMYTQYRVERNRRDLWAPYPAPAKIKVVVEPTEGLDLSGKPSREEVLRSLVARGRTPLLRLRELVDRQKLSGKKSLEFREPFDIPSPASLSRLEAKMLRLDDLQNERGVRMGGAFDQSLADPLPRAEDGRRILAVDGLEFAPASNRPASASATPDKLQAYFNDQDEALDFKRHQGQQQRERLWTLLPASPTPEIVDGEKKLKRLNSQEISGDGGIASLLYAPVRYQRNDNLFADLVRLAPGMDTSRADVLAVLESDAAPAPENKPGKVDEQARALFARARKHGWVAVKVPARGEVPAFTLTFDADGRFAYERVLPPGIREQVVSDGKTLWHLYPDLGLGARRTLSRFHRQELQAIVPWAVPAADDLAHGADLVAIDERTVALVPHGAGRKDRDGKEIAYHTVQFVFAGDGRLAERRLVAMPDKKVLGRELHAADGTVRRLDADDREVERIALARQEGKEPGLTPKTDRLVVLDLPYRTPEHVRKVRKTEKKGYGEMTMAEALPLLAAYAAQRDNGQAREVFNQAFSNREQRQIGFYVLLASAGANLDSQNTNVLGEHLHEPLAQYLALYTSPVLREHASQWAVGSEQFKGGFLQKLALTHALLQRWQNLRALGATDEARQAELTRAENYIKENGQSPFALVLLTLVQQRAEELGRQEKETKPYQQALARLWPLFADHPGLGSLARYEEARALFKQGRAAEAAKRWLALHAEQSKEGGLPRIDGDFYRAFLEAGKEGPGWTEFLRTAAKDCLQKNEREAVMMLAWQCWQLGDEGNALELVRTASEGIEDVKARDIQRRLALQFYWRNERYEHADKLLREMLADPKQPDQAELWLLAARLAEQREMPRRRLECLEKADALGVPASSQRELQSALLSQYRALTESMITLGVEAPADFKDRVVRAADRWRALQPDAGEPCARAEEVLRLLGDRELAWDYATTPLGLNPFEASSWVALGSGLARRGESDLADKAYAAAFEAEPTNAQILFDRAQMLRQAGKADQAKTLFRRLVEGTWQPRFRHLQDQARAQLER